MAIGLEYGGLAHCCHGHSSTQGCCSGGAAVIHVAMKTDVTRGLSVSRLSTPRSLATGVSH